MPYQAKGLIANERYCFVYAEDRVREQVRSLVGYSKDNPEKGYVQLALSKTNLVMLGKIFQPLPNVLNGKDCIDKLKAKVAQQKEYASFIRRVLAKPNTLLAGETQLMPPYTYQFKIPPKDHQLKCFLVIDYVPELNVMLDCGTGKTFIMLTSTENKIQKGKLQKGKTLVSCPLSIIETSWLDDAKKFTNLKIGVLWSSKGAKTEYTSYEEVDNFGPKPEYCIGAKLQKKRYFRNIKEPSQLLPKLTPFHKKDDWERVEVTYRAGTNCVNGQEVRFGPCAVKRVNIVSQKRTHIQSMLADPSYDMYIINHDGVRLHEDVLTNHGFEQVIIDESTKIKNTWSKTYRSHIKISSKATYRYAMSGTPAPNGAIDLWGQFFFADRGMTLEPVITDYKNLFFDEIHIGTVRDKSGQERELKKYVVKPDCLDEVRRRIASSSVRYRQDECLDLPERTNVPRPVPMTLEQSKAYLDMEKDLLSEFVDKNGIVRTVEASTSLVRLLRLRQITSGFASAAEGSMEQLGTFSEDPPPKLISDFPSNVKLDALEGIVDEIGESKIVVVANYTHEIDLIMERFKELRPNFIDGRKKAQDRPKVINDFQNNPSCRMVVLHPQAAGHGITLTAAHYMCFFSMTNNYEHEYQVAKRIERMGQKNSMIMLYLHGTLDPAALNGEFYSEQCETIDKALYRLLREKENTQANLIDNMSAKDFDMNEKAFHDILDQMIRRHHNEPRTNNRGKGKDILQQVPGADGMF